MEEKINSFLVKTTEVVGAQKHLNAIKMAIIALLPILTVVGLLVLASSFSETLFPLMKSLYVILLKCIPLYLAYYTAFHLAKEYDMNATLAGSCALLISAVWFVLNRSFSLSSYALAYANAFWISLVMVEVMHISSKLTLTKLMSDPIPPAVPQYFDNLIPVLAGLVVGMGLIYFIAPIGFKMIADVFLTLTSWVASYVGVLVVVILTCSFWILGIHGVGVIGTILRPFWFFMIIWNIYLYCMNQTPIYIGSEAFLTWFVWMGGSGCTIGASIWMRYFAKSTHLKAIGKQAYVSGFFNINEPVIFGMPIAGNKIMKLPFILVPFICATLSYYACATGLMVTPIFLEPWVLPAVLGGYLASGLALSTLVFVVIIGIISFVLYCPFLVAYDKKLCEEEQVCAD